LSGSVIFKVWHQDIRVMGTLDM